eukprot:TRINITY_DN60876_c0_g1_i1.p1 TRINITY_DN60876_c0_g1~~TRINITY_DN60876_c0_g1_i1.p1  ORF type:complete len:328 (+),score=74.71 TRINITY_DN60876_c0_g1_i1:35-985(+)
MPSSSAVAGYASDDECEPKSLPQGYGALPGDKPEKRKLTASEVLEYGVRQNSSGSGTKKVRFLDAVLGGGYRPSPAQTKPRNSFEHHVALLGLLKKAKFTGMKSDFAILRESHRFLREEADDDGSWEAKIARRYYDRLFKEYVICDLSGYRKGNVGFRWRTETEVLRGRGQFSCGHKRCMSEIDLNSYEVDFKYSEAGCNKRVLVKVRLCQDCAFKLHYRRLKAARRKQKKGSLAKDKHEQSSREAEGVSKCEEASSSEEGKGEKLGGVNKDDLKSEAELSESDKRALEALVWSGPDPAAQTREDEIDEYLRDLFM